MFLRHVTRDEPLRTSAWEASIALTQHSNDLLLVAIKQEIRRKARNGRPIKCQGWKGEKFGVNCVTRAGGFQHWR